MKTCSDMFIKTTSFHNQTVFFFRGPVRKRMPLAGQTPDPNAGTEKTGLISNNKTTNTSEKLGNKIKATVQATENRNTEEIHSN